MKSKLIVLCVTALGFGLLAPLSGAWPARAADAQAAIATAELEAEPVPLLSVPASPASVVLPSPTATPSPTPSPSPTPTPSPTHSPSPTPDEPVVAATTIRSSGLLKNQSSQSVDCEALLAEPLSLSLSGEGPQILIVHTHATEAYWPVGGEDYESGNDYRSCLPEYNMLRVGEALKAALEAQGFEVLHDQGLYDYPSYSGSYSRSAEAVQRHLDEHPSIALVLDLHRDALGGEDLIYKTLAADTAEPTAQLMFVVGTDENLSHPNWRENLKLALQLQQRLQTQQATLMRPIHLTGYRYNQQLSCGSLIVEVGTCGNTLDEALRAVELLAEGLGGFLTEIAYPVV